MPAWYNLAANQINNPKKTQRNGVVIRAFIAIQLPAEVKHKIGNSIAQLRKMIGEGNITWVKPSIYHLTLKFLGDIKIEDLKNISSRISGAASKQTAFEMGVSNFGVFPAIKKPRVLWIGLTENTGALNSLKVALDKSLQPLGFDIEPRQFHPHVTVGRVRRNASRQAVRDLVPSLGNFSVEYLASVVVNQIELVRSDLTPSGPKYSTLENFQLGGFAE
jgi:2'-5' RNA ligase